MGINLVDALSEPGSEDPGSGKRRKFSMPIASIPPGMTDFSRTINVNNMLFHPEDAAEEIPSDNHALIIDVIPTSGYNFTDDNDNLPDPAIRLHAVSYGFLRFKPAEESIPSRLILEMIPFNFFFSINNKAPWFERWMEADCVPRAIIYENVDRDHLEQMLNIIRPHGAPSPTSLSDIYTVELPITSGERIPPVITLAYPTYKVNPTFGLVFPAEVVEGNKPRYIEDFLSGDEDAFLIASPGAYIGKVASKNPFEASDPDSEKRLILKVYYYGHTDTNPRYMNPREFFHLLFGSDSVEAIGNGFMPPHPLLSRIHNTGLNVQNDIELETKRMVLRPPLRTHARVQWEAKQEVVNHRREWARYKRVDDTRIDVELDVERLYNTFDNFFHFRATNEYHLHGWKCNLFVFEICLRSGFRVRVFSKNSKVPTNGGRRYEDVLYYYFVNMLAREIREVSTWDSDRGCGELVSARGVRWGRRWGLKLITIESSENRGEELNRMMNEEGRCFVLVRPKSDDSGHIMLLDEVGREDPSPMTFWEDVNLGLRCIQAKVTHTLKYAGAVNSGTISYTPHKPRGYPPGVPPVSKNVLSLMEMVPGKDPDTNEGLEDLNALL